MEENAKSAKELFSVERVFNAPVELVWEAYTTPQYVARWWGPRGAVVIHCTIDFKVGGRFHYGMKFGGEHEHWNVGEFKEIVPLKKIVAYMWMSNKAGEIVPPPAELGEDFAEDAPDVTLFESLPGGKTKITLVTNHTVESAKKSGMDEGYKQVLDKLEDVLKSVK